MRIRKNLKLSSTSCSSSEDITFNAHVCQLNQSPWDLIPFDDSLSIFQLEYDDSSFTPATPAVNGDSIGAVESVASMMDIDERAKMEDVAAVAMMELVDDNAKGSVKLVGGGNRGGSNNNNKKPAAGSGSAPAGRGSSRAGANKARAAGLKKPAAGTGSATNPYEFYYYSGFGPSWSTRRRGERNSAAMQRSDDGVDVGGITTTTTAIVPSTITDDVVVVGRDNNVEELEYEMDLMDDEDDDDDDDDDGSYYYDDGGDYGKNKRMRKPVKARSLKSLM